MEEERAQARRLEQQDESVVLHAELKDVSARRERARAEFDEEVSARLRRLWRRQLREKISRLCPSATVVHRSNFSSPIHRFDCAKRRLGNGRLC